MATAAPAQSDRRRWVTALVPLLVLGAAIAALIAFDAPGIERRGVPVEELVVDRTTLRPGQIELHVRNDGPDPVSIEQAVVNDAFVPFTTEKEKVGRLAATTVKADYPWIEGQRYDVRLLTAKGGTIDHTVDVATETPGADAGFFGVMGLIGLYVGIIPIAIGMLWLPWLRRLDERWIRLAMAVTIGLLVWLGIDAIDEGEAIAGQGSQALGGATLVFAGAIAAYLTLAGIGAWLGARQGAARSTGRGTTLALLIAVGVGLHNLGEGLAIGSAYAIGSLALGVGLVVGFALHNTTEGLAIVAPAAGDRIPFKRLLLLGAIAGLPVIPGALIGAAAYDPNLAALMLGIGAGAIAQVVVQIAPSLRDRRTGALLNPLAAAGVIAGIAVMYGTGLLVSI
jgi:ZIP family zinc transporter